MFRFYDTQINTKIFMQLQDITTVLSGNPNLQFEYSYGALIDVNTEKLTAAKSWEKLDRAIMEAGLKTDLFLRVVGTLKHSELTPLKTYHQETSDTAIPSFASQLLSLLEDIRLEEIIKKERPGTRSLFSARKKYFQHYFSQQLATNMTRGYQLDALFCMIYLLIQSDSPELDFPRANTVMLQEIEKIKAFLYSIYEADMTKDVTAISLNIVSRVNSAFKDMINEYYIFPVGSLDTYTKNTLFDELTRTDELVNNDIEDVDEEKSEYFDETFSTWHRENKNENRKQNFLQFELEQGTKTSMFGGGVRETEDADQAIAAIQGASADTKEKDYSKLEALEKEQTEQMKHGTESVNGEANADAVLIVKDAVPSALKDEALYQAQMEEIEFYKRKLANIMKKTIEHKRNDPRKDLLYGRLSKNLISVALEDSQRIFYKKNEESKEIDAVFTLLVDCSASMVNKMEETKKGVILFHEVLKQLLIPHAIIGFWEDANKVRDGYQPNYFHRIHSHQDSLHEQNGAKIMQLEPEEDNRDGFSIRMAVKELKSRREKNKFLLVFSDGEPAAAGYDQNGIIDTHLAVSEGRKQGIDIIGMFLADGEITEREELLMKNIYGREHIIVPTVAKLAEHFTPLLKKLLLKTI